MKRIGLALVLAILALPLGAQELQKCLGPKGQVSYTQYGCPKGWKLHHSIYTYPEPPPSAQELQRRENAKRKGEGEGESRYLQQLAGTGSAQGHSVSIARNGSACESAKAHREDVLRAVGLSRTVDLLRALDEEVFNACR